jgi:cell division transport system permease protein
LNRLLSSITRAVASLKQNWLISSITIGIISVCLFLVGGYLLITHNLQGAINAWKEEVTVSIYLRDGFQEADILALQDRLSSLPEVHAVTYISKERALEEFRGMLGDNEELVGGLDRNPLPASLRLIPRDAHRNYEGVRSILNAIGDDPLVEEIQYGKEWLSKLDNVLTLLHVGAVGLGLALSLAAVFIISNTIKITVMARKEELDIMRLVGATESFIRLPFLVEGIIQGLAGSVISLGFLLGLYRFLTARGELPVLKVLHINSLSFLSWLAIVSILASGMLIGGLGSLASVGRHSR